MKINGRNVEAVTYGNTGMINIYVRLKDGDCRKKKEPSYTCLDNCEDNLVLARFIQDTPFSVKAIAFQEIFTNLGIAALRSISDLAGLERVAQSPGYTLKDYKKGKVLYLHGQQVAGYNPCGFTMQQQLFNDEVKQTIQQICTKISEIERIAKKKPLEAILEDKALANHLNNPMLMQMMARLFGSEGERLVNIIREMQRKRN